jgi:hypothetical protein
MDEAPLPDTDDEEDAPLPPPEAFGLSAEPVGCSLVAGLGFAALVAPFVFMPPGSSSCLQTGDDCVAIGHVLAANVAVTAILALGFAAATAWMIRGRFQAWREGRRVRPPLWVGFVALLVLGWAGAGLALGPLLVLAQMAVGANS